MNFPPLVRLAMCLLLVCTTLCVNDLKSQDVPVISIGDDTQNKTAKKRHDPASFILSASYGATYRDVYAPSYSNQKALNKYMNRTVAKSYFAIDLAMRKPIAKGLGLIYGGEYSNIAERVSEGFVKLMPDTMDPKKVYNSMYTNVSAFIRISETIEFKGTKTQLSFGPMFSIYSSYEGNTLSDDWEIIPINQKPTTNILSGWDAQFSVELELTQQVGIMMGCHGRLGVQGVSYDDGLVRNYNIVMFRAGVVYTPGNGLRGAKKVSTKKKTKGKVKVQSLTG